MSFFLNLPIGKKLLLAFGLMAALMLSLGLFAIYELEKVNYSSTVIVEEHLPRLATAARIDVTTSDYRRRQLRMLEQHTRKRTANMPSACNKMKAPWPTNWKGSLLWSKIPTIRPASQS